MDVEKERQTEDVPRTDRRALVLGKENSDDIYL